MTYRDLLQQALSTLERSLPIIRFDAQISGERESELLKNSVPTLIASIRARLAQPEHIVTLPPMPEHDVHIYGIEDGSSFAAQHHAFSSSAVRDYAIAALRAAGAEVAP